MIHHFSSYAPTKSVVETTDIDQQAQNIRNWQQEYNQMSDGRFTGCLTELAYENLHIFKEYTQCSLRQQCHIAPDSIWLGIPTKANESKINGLDIGENQLMCRSSRDDFELITPEAFNIYGMVINQQTIENIAEVQGKSLIDFSLLGAERLSVNEHTLTETRGLIEQLINGNTLGLNSELQQDMLAELVLKLLQVNSPITTVLPSYSRRKAAVDRVKEYMAEHPQAPVTITQLCEVAFVSRRTLQYSFESILGINPLRFLRINKLNNVRRELKTAPLTVPISVIAANWGFWHPGQFSKDYKQLFGENPSETRSKG
ncbi:helix-turn-helix domain-containing protein [Colwellia echini]|uniref:Helix-turn-helix domain-containing protein n=1 Tax=Colwellia echini TaxID=1982103 RepID=A0ABY3N1A3_9GAMM|nr:helix-turn-helix domain-containing protein [Colwellia echini]TYK67032.1 helix-turn-helix domain-containing protein [Colwellia echini]